jgi:3-isopropylmalate/(R)-2-methylmalate dehydratase large subunit
MTIPILYLADDPARIAVQLQTANNQEASYSRQAITRVTAGPLRDDVSTDEITPVAILSHYDERLGDFAHTGLRVGGQLPGHRYGKGSSREHSPTAEKLAGVRLVIAVSFERIYRQNADNIGLFTSTDFSLLDQLEKGEWPPLEALLAGRDALAAAILREGGMLPWGQRNLASAQPTLTATELIADRPRTLAEKILLRARLPAPNTAEAPRPGEGVFVRADWRFIHEYYTGMAMNLMDQALGQSDALRDPQSIVVFEDHSSYLDESPAHLRNGLVPNMRAMQQAQRDFVARHGLRFHRTLTDAQAQQDDGTNVAGISHAMMAEHYALPGQVVVGTDSHTPHSGALGCLAFGVGTTDMANAFLTGAVRFVWPETVQVVVDAPLPSGVTAKDLMLHLLATPFIRAGDGIGKVFEFCGPGIATLSVDARATLTNMTAELGSLTGIVSPDAVTLAYLRERRGVNFEIEAWMQSDPGAPVAHRMVVEARALTPMFARPGDPGNGVAAGALTEAVRIDIAYGGSCTAGKREDFDQYHAVFAWARTHGLRVPAHVKVYLQYGTTAVRDYCKSQGYDETFSHFGVRILQPSCGACANCGPGSSESANQVTVSAINRNFPGRSGPGQVWLASPPTVIASALAGELTSWQALQDQFK